MDFFGLFGKKQSASEAFNLSGINPKAALYYQEGINKYISDDFRGAALEFSSAINLTSENSGYYTARGTAYEDMGDDELAQNDFQKAYSLDQTNSLAAYRLGMVFSRKQEIGNAITWLKAAYLKAPDIADMSHLGLGTNNILFVGKQIIACNLGNMLMHNGRFEEALSFIDRAIEIEPRYAMAYLNRGIALAELDDIEQARIAFVKAAGLGNQKAISILNELDSQVDDERKAWEKEFKKVVEDDIIKNYHSLVAFKGEGQVFVKDLEQEAIYLLCDSFLQLKRAEGQFPSDERMTDIITCVTDVMKECFPKHYTSKESDFAQLGVRVNLTQCDNIQQVVDDYYRKIRSRD